MDLEFSEEQEVLRASARDFLESECPMSLVREQMDAPDAFAATLWKQMSDLGWVGLGVAEEYGGSGLDLTSLALLFEEMGRVLAPSPLLSTALIGARCIEWGGSEAQRREWLPRLARGELRTALALLEEAGEWRADAVRLAPRESAGGQRLSGRKLFVQDAGCADLLIVPVRTAGSGAEGIGLLLVDASAGGVRMRPIAYNERTRKVYEVVFDEVEVEPEHWLGDPGGGWPVLERVLDHARVALCAELTGGAQKVLELSVGYAKVREQFGQPIGRFQAIQHKCADMLVRTESMKSAVWYAAWALDNDAPDRHTAACLAKAYCCDAYCAVAGDGIQIHGGLGFTWEQDLHLYYKHARAAEPLFGDPAHHRELAAAALLD